MYDLDGNFQSHFFRNFRIGIAIEKYINPIKYLHLGVYEQ